MTMTANGHAEMKPAGIDQSQWPIMAQSWRRIGPPLRPGPQDIAIFQSIIDEWATSSDPAPRGLILGVTPELYHLAWPGGSRPAAADRTPEMIEYVWPGSPADVLRADWREIPCDDRSFDLVLCDGGLHLLAYPDAQAELKRTLARLVAPGGLVGFRLFASPAEKERPGAVLAALRAGKISDLNCLKLRLGMALQESSSAGVAVREIWEVLRAEAPSWDDLAKRLGWDLDHLIAIDAYRHSAARYYFISAREAVGLFTGDGGEFEFVRAETPDYPLGERCPTVVFRRSAV